MAHYNNYTYTLVPENKRNVICSHYDSDGYVVNGYIIIDNCKNEPDMQGKHVAIWNACKNHNYPQEILDALKLDPNDPDPDPVNLTQAQAIKFKRTFPIGDPI